MASAFTHAFAAVALGKAYTSRQMPVRFWFLSAACAVLPDADVVGFAFNIAYGDMLGHRGFSHSLVFALMLSSVVVALAFRDVTGRAARASLVCYFFIVTASHALLDALTNGGLGVAFFAPFSNARFFFPFRPVEVSPLAPARFFTGEGLEILASELVWVWIPFALLALIVSLYRRFAHHG